jgi:hypothetical protein
MKAQLKPGWSLTPEQRHELRRLHLAAVKGMLASPEPIDATDPDVLALLDYWEGCKTPWDLAPRVNAYRCKGGEWLVESVPAVLTAMAMHLGEGA